MIKSDQWPVGVCSWSIKDDLGTLHRLSQELKMEYVHLNSGPAMTEGGGKFLDAVASQGWTISCMMVDFAQEDYSTPATIKVTGGIVPDDYWDINRQRVLDAIDLTAKLKVKCLSTHFGFIELDDTDGAKKILDRTKLLADKAAENNIQLLMETGQETADELRQFLEELNHPALGVNFDPANMILYDKGNPLEAIQTLAPWIKHVHIKDGIRTEVPGTWGQEVPWGDGQVGGDDFLKALRQIGYSGVLAIEREAGENRFEDIKLAAERLSKFSG